MRANARFSLITLRGYLNGLLIESMTAELSAINTWMPFLLQGQFDEIELFGIGSGFHPFGIDNLNWLWVQRNSEPPGVPVPGTLMLMLAALAAGTVVRLRRC